MTHSFSLSVRVFLDMGLWGGGNDFPAMGWVMGLREEEGRGYNIWCSGVDPFLVQFFSILPEIKDCIL